MSKYQTEAGIECTPEECKLIDSLKRLAKKWEKDGKRLWLYSASGSLHVMMQEIQTIILHRNLRNMEVAILKIV